MSKPIAGSSFKIKVDAPFKLSDPEFTIKQDNQNMKRKKHRKCLCVCLRESNSMEPNQTFIPAVSVFISSQLNFQNEDIKKRASREAAMYDKDYKGEEVRN